MPNKNNLTVLSDFNTEASGALACPFPVLALNSFAEKLNKNENL